MAPGRQARVYTLHGPTCKEFVFPYFLSSLSDLWEIEFSFPRVHTPHTPHTPSFYTPLSGLGLGMCRCLLHY